MPKAIVNGINMYYEVHGHGEPLILIHGFGEGHRSWLFQIHTFKKYFQVITFDGRGTGKTSRSKEPFTIRTMANDVIGLMDELGIDRAHILGLSLGGMVAQELTFEHPQRVRKLILASTFTTTERTDHLADLLKSFAAKDDVKSIDFNRLMSSIISLTFNKRIYRMLLTTMFKFRKRSANDRGYLEQMEAVKGFDTLGKLQLIQTPTLVINGSGDRLVPHSNSELIASRIPNSRLVTIDEGSHAFFVEMGSRFNKEVLDFLINN